MDSSAEDCVMDFITWKELLLSIIAIVGVFLAVSGAMAIMAAELTEEGRWFSLGVLIPLAIVLLSTFFEAGWRWPFLAVAGVVALTIPWVLAARRRASCLKPVAGGSGLVVLGSLILAVVLNV